MCNPPLLDERTGRRASSLSEAADAVRRPGREPSVRTICFARSRRAAELIYQFARARLEQVPTTPGRDRPPTGPATRHSSDATSSAASPRASCSASSRPTRSSSGSTSATSTRRCRSRSPAPSRACASSGAARGAASAAASRCTSRATTRSTSSSAAIPEEFLDRPVEAAILDHSSESIYMSHLCAAAYEAPLEAGDAETLGAGVRPLRGAARRRGRAAQARTAATSRAAGLPGRASCRCARRRPTASRSSRPTAGELLGFVEAERAFSTVHPGAVYLHLGEPYEVEELDIDARRALVRPAEGDYYTQPKIETETFIEETREERDALGVGAAVRHRVGDAGGGRLPAQAPVRPRGDRPPHARPAGAELRHAGALVRARRGAGRRAAAARAAGRAARDRALADRGAAADRDVRPLGHRRPLDQLPPPDRLSRRSSSTTAIPAASGSRGGASTSSSAWSATRAA